MTELHLYIHGDVDRFTTRSVLDALRGADGGVSTIRLHINSPGGDVFDGVTVYSMLKNHRARVVADIEGFCASIASVIVMAADEIIMHPGSRMMIHQSSAGAQGEAGDLRKQADQLDAINDQMADIYSARTGMDKSECMARMAEETWMSPEEAVAAGFADRVGEAKARRAAAATMTREQIESFGYRKVPTECIARQGTRPSLTTRPTAEGSMDELLMSFITQVAEVSGLDPVAAVKALSQMGDRIGGLLRSEADGQEMKPREEKLAPPEEDPKPEPEPEEETAAADEEPAKTEKKPEGKQMSLQLPADAVKLSEIEARAKQTDELMALKASVASLMARLDGRDKADAEAKAASEKAEREAFIASEIKCGRVEEHERDDFLFVLASENGRARYDNITKNRVGTGKPVPIGVKQAESETSSVTPNNGEDLTADFTASERVALQTMTAGMGYARPAAIEKIRSRRAAAN